MPTTSREIHLVKRPEGEPVLDDFAMVETIATGSDIRTAPRA